MARTKGSKLSPQRKYDAICALLGNQTTLTEVADRYRISPAYLSTLHSKANENVMQIAGFKKSKSISLGMSVWEKQEETEPNIKDTKSAITECKRILAKLSAKINSLE